VGEREVTDLLRRHGLPLNPLRVAELEAAQKRLDTATWAELIKAGLFPDAEGMTEGLWRSEAKFHWLRPSHRGRRSGSRTATPR